MALLRNYTKRGQIHHKIIMVLKACDGPVTPDEIKQVFAGTYIEKTLSRLSTYMWNIKEDGGIIKLVKKDRKITSYELVNRDEFNDVGRKI